MPGINHERVVSHQDKGLADDWNADHKQKGHHDCEQFQHLNHVWENRTDWPAGPVVGQVVYRTDYNNFFGWNGTAWQSLTPVATVVVAADGTGNFLTIQEGIDALPATGGVVYIKEGTYIIDAKITINKESVTLIGAGHSTIIQNSVQIQYIFEVAATTDYFVAEKIQFDATGTIAGNGCVIVFLGATTNSRLSTCWLDHWSPRGIVFLDAGENISIEKCVFEPVVTIGPDYAVLINNSSSGFINGNYIFGGTNVYGIQFTTGTIKHFSVLDNKIRDCVAGVSIFGGGEITGENIMIANSILDCSYGVYLEWTYNNIILGNEIDNAVVGVFAAGDSDHNNIGHNRIKNCDVGVYIDSVLDTRNSIVGNNLVGNTIPILDDGDDTEIGHNTT